MPIIDKFGVALRDMHESLGDKGTEETIKEMLKDGTLKPSDWNVVECWNAFERDPKTGIVKSYHEAVSSDMFPTINGEIINAAIIGAYNIPGLIGDQLCTTVPGKHEIERFVGFDAVEMPEEVQQGRDYNDSDMGEKYATIQPVKVGRLLKITEEALFYDQSGILLQRAAGIGRKLGLEREQRIVQNIQDINSNVYRPSGIAEAIYSSSRTESGVACYNLVTSNPFGESGLDAVTALVHDMVDENGDPIFIDEMNVKLLYPNDIKTQVLQMAGTLKVPEGMDNAINIYQGKFTPLSSPYISQQSTSTWFYGTFVEDFVWLEHWPLQTFTARPGNMKEFTADIKSQHKVRYLGNIGARDFRHSYKCTA